MPQIMQESGQSYDLPFIVFEPEMPAHQTRHMENPERVVKACVESTRINQIGHCKLTNPPQPLEEGGADDLDLLLAQLNEVVDRISDLATFGHDLRPP